MKKVWILLFLLSSFHCLYGNSDKTNSKKSGDSAVNSSNIIVVEDMKGKVEIPANPKRIVDVSGSADELIIMGIPFVGSANTSMFDSMVVPSHLQEYFKNNNVEIVGNYSGLTDLNLEKIVDLKPDLIIMNIRHEKVYNQLKTIAPTVMLSDDIYFVNWRGRFKQLGNWFGKEDIVMEWFKEYDRKANELSAKIKEVVGDETFAVIEANSAHFGSYYIYRTGGAGSIIYDEFKLNPSSGVPENVWGKVVDAEYFSKIDADKIFFFSDDGKVGEVANIPTWKNMKAVKNGNVYYGINDEQYNMAYTPNGKYLYMDKLANMILNNKNAK